MDEKKVIYFEIVDLEKQLKEKKERLCKICDHMQFNGQSAWVVSKAHLSCDDTKKCSICGAMDWA